MAPTNPAKGIDDGGHKLEGVHDNKRAKALAPSKGKKDAAGPASSKKRAAGASTSKAAKKNRTSASTCQVRSDMNSAHGQPIITQCDSQNLTW